MEFNFEEIFQTVLKNRQKDWDKRSEGYERPINVIKPSSIGDCMRKQYFDEAGMGEKPDGKLLKIFAHGNFIHDDFIYPIIQEFMKRKKNMAIINEYPLLIKFLYKETVLELKGFIDDLIIETTPDGVIFTPIEAKSIGDRFYRLREPDYQHQIQLQMYMEALDVDEGYVLYVHKATLDSKSFLIKRDKEIFKMLLRRAEQMFDYKKEGIIPIAEAMINKDDFWFKKKCDWCPYLEFCKSQDQGEIKSE